jgi:signal peptide peptidase SppA
MSFSLIRTIAAQPWLIEPDYAQQVAPFIAGLLSGNATEWDQQENVSITFSHTQAAASPAGSPGGAVAPGSVAIYKMMGPLMKQDQFCGPKGMDSIAADLQSLDANTNIDAIVLQIDSPGGTVAGTENLARTVANLKKPVVAYVDGTMASAAYWIGSSARHVMMSGRTSAVGSIGTIFSMADVKPVLEKAGVKFHTIRASRSVDKNTIIEQALQGSYDDLRTKMLDPVNLAFTESVEANRSGKLDLEKEDVLTGKMYIGKKAIKAGLADSMGSLEDAIAMARNLARTPRKYVPRASLSSQKLSEMKINESFPRMSAVAAIDAEAETLENGSVELTATEMQAIEAALTAAGEDAAALATASADLEEQRRVARDSDEALQAEQALRAIAEQQLTEAQATIATLQAQVQQLSDATPPAPDTTRETDPTPTTKSKELPSVKYAQERGIYSKA